MKLIKEKYRALKPTIDYLADEVVMAQAWKKTHGYIRSFNWYADTLELDVSALGIEQNAKKWATSVKSARLHKLELVPAAKSEVWAFDKDGWKPKDIQRRQDKPPVRPLAHMTIRDQTWASAAMLCLADAVESAQGDCSHKSQTYEQARNNKVYSYGNRLICDWKNKETAWFRWGNSETYRKFFTDYQNFLKRPIELGRIATEQTTNTEDVFIVNLDLSKFYNTIDIDLLVGRLKDISSEFEHPECPTFWSAFKRITSWSWYANDLKIAEKLKLGEIDSGLPQGLVSAGFYANAYLVEFDREVGSLIGRKLSRSIILHDYCRYVDDLRLVVSSSDKTPSQVAKIVNRRISKLLKEYGGKQLEINSDKTKVTLLNDLDNSGSMANRIEMIQSEMSGPADRDVLETVSGVLENLLDIEEAEVPKLAINHVDSALLQLSDYDHDIRPDTLKRFAANRLENIVKSKRRITPPESNVSSSNNEELLAKKLISAWMKDPSLALVLRKAVEIYPDADLFEPVFDAIFRRSSYCTTTQDPDLITAQIMDYILADLCRCAIDFNGYFQVVDYPKNLEPSSIIELISRYAQKVLASGNVSRFVERQALMLLAVVNKPLLLSRKSSSPQSDLHSILVCAPPEYKTELNALFEVAGQITGKFDTYASLFLESISGSDDRYNSVEVFAKRGGPFWLALWKALDKKAANKELCKQLKWAAPQLASQPKPRKQLLSKVINSELNGFEFEHGLLKLALGLLIKAREDIKVIGASPNEIYVDIKPKVQWNKVWNSSVKEVNCTISATHQFHDPRFKIPNWIDSEKYDARVIYWIGSVLRTSVLGSGDFTASRWKQGQIVTYKGLRTSWYKRRMGMMHAPESLVGEFATTSNWFSDFLIRCLQWPGFESTFVHDVDVRSIECLESFENCLHKRLRYLDSLICEASSLPVIPTQVNRPRQKDNFRIVTVQQLLPRSVDFSVADPYLNNSKYRSKHREHLLSISRLTLKTLQAKAHAENEKFKPYADLIVFAELAVHIDDQDVIKRLADTTGAIIFAGLVFTDHEGKLINIARWFIPDYRESGRQWVIRDQGKENMTKDEVKLGVSGFRPCQHVVELHGYEEGPFRISGSICYDATDIKLAADLRNITDLYIVVAHNQDVNTFDNMAAALQYHMYQHVVICNIGEFGGSTIQAPYKERFERLISHAHGSEQISISTADIDLAAFTRKVKQYKAVKTKPAGIRK